MRVAVPEDLDGPTVAKATGRVELPFDIRWSGPPIAYDLDDRADRARVYEQVLREASEDDVRFYVQGRPTFAIWGTISSCLRRYGADELIGLSIGG